MKSILSLLLLLLLLCTGFTMNAQPKKVFKTTPYFVSINTEYKHQKARWASSNKQHIELNIDANKGEWVVFELGILANKSSLKNITIHADDLLSKGGMGSISGSFLRYADSKEMLKTSTKMLPFSIEKGDKQVIYAVFDIPRYLPLATFRGKLNINVEGLPTQTINVSLTVAPK